LGIKYIIHFEKSLAGQNLWRLTQGNSLWIRIMNSKYFPLKTVAEWFKSPLKSSKGSNVWKALTEELTLVGDWMVWNIGDEKNICVG
jgi:hypothetical protein